MDLRQTDHLGQEWLGAGIRHCPLAVLSTGATSTDLASDLPGATKLLLTGSPPQLGGLQDGSISRALSFSMLQSPQVEISLKALCG